MSLVFDIPLFRLHYPEFADILKYPDDRLQFYWDTALCYISVCGRLHGTCLYMALELMTAHLAKLADLNAEQDQNSLPGGATVDRVSITLVPPPIIDQWEWWYNTTNYGQQLLAFLKVKSIGGVYYGGSFERFGFRKFGGGF